MRIASGDGPLGRLSLALHAIPLTHRHSGTDKTQPDLTVSIHPAATIQHHVGDPLCCAQSFNVHPEA